MSNEGFDWNKWSEGGSDPSAVPSDIRMKMRAAWDSKPSNTPLEALFRTQTTTTDDDEAPLRKGDVMGLINEVRRKDRFDQELTEVKTTYGDAYDKYSGRAAEFIKEGYGPKHAFRLASHDDLLAAAEEKGKRAALEGLQSTARNGEQPVRGNGAHGSGTSNNTGGSGNGWIDDKEAYDKKRSELSSSRVDFSEAAKFRIENPDFVQAEFHHGDLKKVNRRGPR